MHVVPNMDGGDGAAPAPMHDSSSIDKLGLPLEDSSSNDNSEDDQQRQQQSGKEEASSQAVFRKRTSSLLPRPEAAPIRLSVVQQPEFEQQDHDLTSAISEGPPPLPSTLPPPRPSPATTTEENGQHQALANGQQHHQLTLEERVQELETKLAVLSHLLKRSGAVSAGSMSMMNGRGNSTPPRRDNHHHHQDTSSPPEETFLDTSTAETPPPTRTVFLTPLRSSSYPRSYSLRSTMSNASSTVPHLESPAPMTRKTLHVVHDSAESASGGSDGDRVHFDFTTDPRSIERANSEGQHSSSSAGKEAGGDDATTTCSASTKRKRNLSFRLLYENSEEAKREDSTDLKRLMSNAPVAHSLTPADRADLGPRILQFANERAAAEAASRAMSTDSHPLKSDKLSRSQTEETESTKNSSTGKPTIEASGTTACTPSPSSTSTTSPIMTPDDTVRNKWLMYLNSFQEPTPDVDLQMQEFIKVPGKVENIMSFGVFVCVDSFLYMITILPIRFVWSALLLLLRLATSLTAGRLGKVPQHYHFHRRHTYQLIQVTILWSIYRFVLSEISIGKLYHWIRGQSMIKLYVLIAIIEVFDRLFCSLGQDCLSSMYWNTVSRPRSCRMLISVAVVWVYATLHSLILFVHVATLNVAMNSSDQALLTLLISGNFAEIKSTVFKKYNKAALFKISASDICERFKLGLFLSLVLMLNLSQGMSQTQFFDYCHICVIVWLAELVSDWIKHCFITKFNFLPSKVYHEYALLLAGDVTGIGHEGTFNLDQSHAVVKRIGFAQIPLVSVMFRLVRETFKYAFRHSYIQESGIMEFLEGDYFDDEEESMILASRSVRYALVSLLGWLCILAMKMALGRLLHGSAMSKLLAAPDIIDTAELRKKQK